MNTARSSEEINSKNISIDIKQISKTPMIIALIVNIMGLLLIFNSVTHFNRNLIEVQEAYSRVQTLHGEVLRIDEILTMSCWVASTTSDKRWVERYEMHVPILDQTLSELIELTPSSMHSYIKSTTSANTILVDFETQALQASRENNRSRALELLTSNEYASQKDKYSMGMRMLEDALNQHFQGLLQNEYRQIKHREWLIFIIIFGLAIFWVVIFRTASSWQKMTGEYLRMSNKMKESLQERLADNLQIAKERGVEIQNLRRALLQSELQERKRLGRLVHDDLQQLIAALRLKSSMYRDISSYENDRNAYQELVSLADEALTSTRDLVMRLTPPGEHQSSLLDMITAICTQFKHRYSLLIEVDSSRFIEPRQLEVRQLLSRAIRELLFNVVKYANVKQANIELWSADDYHYCRVSDNGVGFDVDQLPTDTTFIRTGLGLLGMREQLAIVGGSIHISSQIGDGTSIELRIPSTSSSNEPMEVKSQNTQSIELEINENVNSIKSILTHKILIVDDNHALREMLIQLFQSSNNFTVVGEASSGPEAVMQSEACTPDILLIDYSLPGFDGAEATKQIVKKLPNIRVIGFTSFDIVEVIDHFMDAGAAQVMLKDSDPQHLLNACMKVIEAD